MMELLTGEGGLVGDVMEDRQSLSAWDPPEEATPDERYPFCKEEPLEDRNALHNDFTSPTDLSQHVSVGIKEEPDSCQAELVISPIMEGPEGESLLHTEVSMSGDVLHLRVVTHQTPTQVKEELFVSDEGLLEEPDVPPQCPSALIPQEASLEGEVTDVVCFKWDVVGPKKKPRQILPKPGHKAVKGKRFSCAECGKCLRSNADLIRHNRVHSGEKPFQCSECGKLFSKQSSLAIHHRIHTGQKPYSCAVCGKCFTSRSELTKHGRSHTGLKPYTCPECGKFFTCSSNLFRHKKIHTGEKQFVCSECGKSFLTRSQMVIHQRVHTGEKPYPCSECAKCFVSSSDLAKHQRSHTGLKPHICPECGKSYVSSSVLTRHQKIHRAEKRFFCAECGMGFVRTGKFLSHIKTHGRPRTSSRTPKLNLVPRPASDFLQDFEIKSCPTAGLGLPGLKNESLSHIKAHGRPLTSSRTQK
ncbi:gastrula zinc finger protein XlCGF57.1-like [Rana temporaria]|uniref:gastrula zinc finger protein XlCGF57.1-like n=1 Tax=Rana temporaria TaxID=8407 RepID=UPI001AAC78C5|nr:gastrula zinc finger protein XlCGF57.1-like [Rana temporaria]